MAGKIEEVVKMLCSYGLQEVRLLVPLLEDSKLPLNRSFNSVKNLENGNITLQSYSDMGCKGRFGLLLQGCKLSHSSFSKYSKSGEEGDYGIACLDIDIKSIGGNENAGTLLWDEDKAFKFLETCFLDYSKLRGSIMFIQKTGRNGLHFFLCVKGGGSNKVSRDHNPIVVELDGVSISFKTDFLFNQQILFNTYTINSGVRGDYSIIHVKNINEPVIPYDRLDRPAFTDHVKYPDDDKFFEEANRNMVDGNRHETNKNISKFLFKKNKTLDQAKSIYEKQIKNGNLEDFIGWYKWCMENFPKGVGSEDFSTAEDFLDYLKSLSKYVFVTSENTAINTEVKDRGSVTDMTFDEFEEHYGSSWKIEKKHTLRHWITSYYRKNLLGEGARNPVLQGTVYDGRLKPYEILKDANGYDRINIYCPPVYDEDLPEPSEEDKEFLLDYLNKFLEKDEMSGLDISASSWLMFYMAWLLQNPTTKLNYALLLVGERGVGKSMFSTLLTNLKGVSNVVHVTVQTLMNPANEILNNKDLVVVHEIHEEGVMLSKKHLYNMLQSYITESGFSRKKLFKDIKSAKNSFNFILCTNYIDALPLAKDERRYAVFYTSPHKKQDEDYFKELDRIIQDKSVLKWFTKMLFDIDIEKSFSSRNPPKTKSLYRMINMSSSSIDTYLAMLLSNESFPFDKKIICPSTLGYDWLPDKNNFRNVNTSNSLEKFLDEKKECFVRRDVLDKIKNTSLVCYVNLAYIKEVDKMTDEDILPLIYKINSVTSSLGDL